MSDLIDVKELTDKESSVVAKLVGAFYAAGMLDTVSEDRTQKARQLALAEGCDAKEADRLTRHFNAATKIFVTMPAAEKEEVYAWARSLTPPKP